MRTVASTNLMQATLNQHFRPSVFVFDYRHIPASGCTIMHIGHSAAFGQETQTETL